MSAGKEGAGLGHDDDPTCMQAEHGGHPTCPHMEEALETLRTERDAAIKERDEARETCHRLHYEIGNDRLQAATKRAEEAEAIARAVEYLSTLPDQLRQEQKMEREIHTTMVRRLTEEADALKAENEKLRAALQAAFAQVEDLKRNQHIYLVEIIKKKDAEIAALKGARKLILEAASQADTAFRQRISVLADALRKARDTFRKYERMHQKKADSFLGGLARADAEAKAARNRAHAEAIEKVLGEEKPEPDKSDIEMLGDGIPAPVTTSDHAVYDKLTGVCDRRDPHACDLPAHPNKTPSPFGLSENVRMVPPPLPVVDASEREEPKAPVCSTCNDTHMMPSGVMCTHCPVPCHLCRVNGNGAFCTSTPCPCACHVKSAVPLTEGER